MNLIATFFLWLWVVITFVPRWLIARWSARKPELFRFVRVEELPDKLRRAKIYLAGEGDNLWAASMICPCGCGAVIELNLLKQARPCWSAQEHPDGTVSLAPSVWRQKGCRSHFFVRHGRIDWC
ncbi:MAG TPA: DUF6527 family protein [Acetobacteraceae bacterium]